MNILGGLNAELLQQAFIAKVQIREAFAQKPICEFNSNQLNRKFNTNN